MGPAYEHESVDSLQAQIWAMQEAIEEKNAAEAKAEEEKPKELKKFRCTVRAFGTFPVEAYDMYEADEIARKMNKSEIIVAVGSWLDVEVNDDEFPEEY